MADVGVDDLPLHLSAQILLQRNEAAHALDDERRAARLALNLHAAVVVTALGKIAVVHLHVHAHARYTCRRTNA